MPYSTDNNESFLDRHDRRRRPRDRGTDPPHRLGVRPFELARRDDDRSTAAAGLPGVHDGGRQDVLTTA